MRYLLAPMFLLASACSGGKLDLGTNGTAVSGLVSVNGNVQGQAVNAPKISAARQVYHEYTVLHLSISAADDFEGVCTGVAKRNTNGLFLEIWEKGGAISTGSYAAGKGIYVSEASLSGDCADFDSSSSDASIDIDTIDDKHVEGRFHAAFLNGDTVTGTFSAPFCGSPQINPEREPCDLCGQELPNYSCP